MTVLSLILAVDKAPAAAGNPVTDILNTFHVTWPNFIAQLVTFLLVALLLKRFAFGPVQDMLEQRRKRIADGEAKLVEVEQQIAESERRTSEVVALANDQAKRLVEEAKESAAALGERKAQEAVASAQQIIAKAEEAAKAEREKMQAELRNEFGRLVTTTTAQVTGKVLDEGDRKRLNDEALATLEN